MHCSLRGTVLEYHLSLLPVAEDWCSKSASVPSQAACSFIKSHVDSSSVDSLFYAAQSIRVLSGCEVSLEP